MFKRIVGGFTLMLCAFVLAMAALVFLVEWNNFGDPVAMAMTLMFCAVSLGSAVGSVLVSSNVG